MVRNDKQLNAVGGCEPAQNLMLAIYLRLDLRADIMNPEKQALRRGQFHRPVDTETDRTAQVSEHGFAQLLRMRISTPRVRC